MEEGVAGDLGSVGGVTSEKGTTVPKKKSALGANGERLRFTVELRSGETTIVSWKKLIKDNNAAIPNGDVQSAADSLSGQPHLSRLPSGPIGEKEGKDAQQSNRFTTVIEKIERLYMGKGSSDEEDNNDVMPDDDEYDTEDSFIDDAELNEYFEVDNSAIKHSGFFVNRGKLERVGTSQLPSEQPKKRRRKDHVEGHNGNESGHRPTKNAKIRKKTATSVPLVGKNALSGAPVTPLPNVPNASESSPSLRKKSADNKMSQQQPLGFVNKNDVISKEKTVVDQQKSGVFSANSHGNKVKEGSEHVGGAASNLVSSCNKTSYKHGESAPEKLSSANLGGGLENVQHKGNASIRGTLQVTPEGKNNMQNEKVGSNQKKEGSRSRQKSTLLEKAIRDLQKLVDESRPPTSEVPESDNSPQAIKKRLSPEIKQKLSKVARLAQATHGKLSNELINRLMSIVGHLIQLRSLKRNLKAMVNTGLSAKQEKDNKVQLVKKEVAEMIKTRIPFIQTKDEEKGRSSDDFQETGVGEKETFKRKNGMDDIIEDKICELYDLFVEGLEEDAGPQVRKLYAEISGIWPNGMMDNNGIKQAIGRAKERRKVMVRKHKAQDPEKMKRKKMMTQKGDESSVLGLEAITITSTVDHGPLPRKDTGPGSGTSSRITNGSSPSGPSKHEKLKRGVMDQTMSKKLKRKHENAVQKSTLMMMPTTTTTGEVHVNKNCVLREE